MGKASAKPSGGSAPYLYLYQVQHFAFGQRMKKDEGKSDASSRGAHRIGVAGRRRFLFFAYCELFFSAAGTMVKTLFNRYRAARPGHFAAKKMHGWVGWVGVTKKGGAT